MTLESFLAEISIDAMQRGGVLQLPSLIVISTRDEKIAHGQLDYIGKQKRTFIYEARFDREDFVDDVKETIDLRDRVLQYLHDRKLQTSEALKTITILPKKMRLSPETLIQAFELNPNQAALVRHGTSYTLNEACAIARGAKLTTDEALACLSRYQQ